MSRIACLLACLLYSITLSAQAEEFVELFRANTYHLSANEQGFGDAGGDMLSGSLEDQQFILIGEAHGLKEVQSFSAYLFKEAYKHGFRHLAVETDPFAAAKVQELGVAPIANASQFAAKYPMAIPFFHSNEGMRFARDVVSLNGTDVWGLDQVFVVGPRYLFDVLVSHASTDAQRKLAESYRDRAFAKFGEAMQTGDPSGVILTSLDESDFEALEEAFADDPASLDIIGQMQLSQEIYQYWFDGEYYLNNSVRSDQMKRLFNSHYKSAIDAGESSPKIVFKFGSNHCIRGLTSTRIYDLGNMVSELAAINETGSLHIKLTAGRGETFNMLAGVQEFDSTEEWHEWLNDALTEPLQSAGDDWLIVDLRALRNLGLKEANEEIKSLIFGWDLWVIIPEATAVTPLE